MIGQGLCLFLCALNFNQICEYKLAADHISWLNYAIWKYFKRRGNACYINKDISGPNEKYFIPWMWEF